MKGLPARAIAIQEGDLTQKEIKEQEACQMAIISSEQGIKRLKKKDTANNAQKPISSCLQANRSGCWIYPLLCFAMIIVPFLSPFVDLQKRKSYCCLPAAICNEQRKKKCE